MAHLASAFILCVLLTIPLTYGMRVNDSPSFSVDLHALSLTFERRQSLPPSDTPTRCKPGCDPIRSLIAGGCTPSKCCNQPFLDGYVNCYKCIAAEIGLTNHRGAQNVVRVYVNDCEDRTGVRLKEPFLPAEGYVSAPPLGSTPVLPTATSGGSISSGTLISTVTPTSRGSSVVSQPTSRSSAQSSASESTPQQVTFRPTSSIESFGPTRSGGGDPTSSEDADSSAHRYSLSFMALTTALAVGKIAVVCL